MTPQEMNVPTFHTYRSNDSGAQYPVSGGRFDTVGASWPDRSTYNQFVWTDGGGELEEVRRYVDNELVETIKVTDRIDERFELPNHRLAYPIFVIAAYVKVAKHMVRFHPDHIPLMTVNEARAERGLPPLPDTL